MNGQIITIKPEFERILFFLYPEYSVETILAKPENFIIRYDICSPSDRNRLENFNNFVVISTKVYDQDYDRELLKAKCLEFRRTRFKTRRRTLNELDSLPDEDFIDSLISFMFTDQYSVSTEEEIMDLFSAYGSLQFVELFLRKANEIPLPKLVSSMFTFISKVMSDTSTIFYKKKFMAYGEKIKRNYPQAIDNFNSCMDDNFGLRYVQFFSSLCR